MNHLKIYILIIGAIIISASLTGCVNQSNTNPPTTNTPTLTITQPHDGASLSEGNITVKVQVSNFNLVDKLGQSNVAGEGHLHYFLDYSAPTTPNQPAVPPSGSNVKWAATANTTYTFHNVSAGSHTINVELVNNNHTPLEPPVTSSVSFTLTSSVASGNSTIIYLKAKDIAFNRSTITVPAGAEVTVFFHNEDSGIPHNFAVYDTPSATKTIFQGKIITGVSSITYTFTAPSTPGTYYFRCDVHPTIMNGKFIVD